MLSVFHFLPAYKAIYVVKKKRDKANNDRDVSCIMNTRKYPHNDKVGQHLSVISKGKRNYTVKQTEYHHKNLSDRISFGTENQRRDTQKRRGKCQIIFSVENNKGKYNESFGIISLDRLYVK